MFRIKILAKISLCLVFIGLITSCSGQQNLPQGPKAVWDLVVIGDSSLWGVGEAYAAQIEKDVGVQVEVGDYSLNAATAGQVLSILQTGESDSFQMQKLLDALREAEVVVMLANPDDSIDRIQPLDLYGCFFAQPPQSCAPSTLNRWTEDLTAIWKEIYQLRDGKAVILRATDLYNPLVRLWTDNGVFEECTVCWENLSAAARAAAEAAGVPFVSRLDAFNGAEHTDDPVEKGFILEDGEHLSPLGAEYTATLLAGLGYEPVKEP